MNHPPLPEPFLERLHAIVPAAEWQAVVATFHDPADVPFRINTLKAEPAAVTAELEAAGLTVRPVAGVAEARWVAAAERPALTAAAAHTEGRLYVQNLASMAAAPALAPRPGEQVLDLAAAPGGKTLHLAALMENRGWLSAVEAVKGRFFRLKANLERYGAGCVHTYLKDGSRVWQQVPERFDRVLLDAPCSSEARIHAADPDSHRYWGPKKIKEMQRKQQRLLHSAIHCLRPGGTLLYSTCSYAPEENEAVVQGQLERFGDALELLPLELPEAFRSQPGLAEWQGRRFAPELALARRILPDHLAHGFFLCLIRKRESTLGTA